MITYPVETDRLDIYNQFLRPAGISPKRHKTIETADFMLQMVASGRGVAALPRWLVREYVTSMDTIPIRLGPNGIAKQIFLRMREADIDIDYLAGFIQMACQSETSGRQARKQRTKH